MFVQAQPCSSETTPPVAYRNDGLVSGCHLECLSAHAQLAKAVFGGCTQSAIAGQPDTTGLRVCLVFYRQDRTFIHSDLNLFTFHANACLVPQSRHAADPVYHLHVQDISPVPLVHLRDRDPEMLGSVMLPHRGKVNRIEVACVAGTKQESGRGPSQVPTKLEFRLEILPDLACVEDEIPINRVERRTDFAFGILAPLTPDKGPLRLPSIA